MSEVLMPPQLIIKFDGYMSEGNRISLRTLAHTLPFLQRAVDKIVIYERQGIVGKGATLHQANYQYADLYLEQLETGSVILPLVGNFISGVAAKFNSFMDDPYHETENLLAGKFSGFDARVDMTRSLISSGALVPISHDELISKQDFVDRDYAQAAFLNDINNMLSPLRSSLCAGDSITITNADPSHSAKYYFDQNRSKAFAKVVREQRLAHPVKYLGRLDGLVNRGGTGFPYVGKFMCKTTKKERKLLVASEADAFELNKHNLGSSEILIVACPLAVYGAFDPLAGDLVFIGFHNDRQTT
ncbi:hypothetical protein [Pseudomonas sp. PIC25]|uniref:hypothetical protein n=1 Tax=Pseudomonas sp. PIC25 TaxID=1958773 RepID=UPI001179F1B8|nr:hypothetical protein [Pseudomonas sp. PIC25]